MAEPITFITPSSKSVTADNAWHNIDVTSDIPGGFSPSGVLVRYRWSGATSNGKAGFRHGDSTDTYVFEGRAETSGCWEQGAAGLNASNEFGYLFEGGSPTLQVIGFFDDTHVVFLTTAATFSPGTSYTDADISSATGGDTATVAIFQICSDRTTAVASFGWRQNGSSDDIYERPGGGFDGNQAQNGCGMVLVGVDGSEVCEFKTSSTFVLDAAILIGYFVSGATWNATASDVSTATTGSWQPISIGAGPTAAYVEMINTTWTDGDQGGLSSDGSADDTHGAMPPLFVGLLEVNGSSEVEQYIGNTDIDAYLRATFQDTGGGGGSSIVPIAMRHYRARRMH